MPIDSPSMEGTKNFLNPLLHSMNFGPWYFGNPVCGPSHDVHLQIYIKLTTTVHRSGITL